MECSIARMKLVAAKREQEMNKTEQEDDVSTRCDWRWCECAHVSCSVGLATAVRCACERRSRSVIPARGVRRRPVAAPEAALRIEWRAADRRAPLVLRAFTRVDLSDKRSGVTAKLFGTADQTAIRGG